MNIHFKNYPGREKKTAENEQCIRKTWYTLNSLTHMQLGVPGEGRKLFEEIITISSYLIKTYTHYCKKLNETQADKNIKN